MKHFFALFLLFSSLLFACQSASNKGDESEKTISLSGQSSKKNRLEVFCFHGTRQCETCKNMKSNTRSVLEQHFASQLKDSSIVFAIVDVDNEKNEKLAEKFQASGTALMVNKVTNGKDSILDWSDFAFEKANEKEVYQAELQSRLEELLRK